MPHARALPASTRPVPRPPSRHRQARRRRVGVDHVDVVEAHAPRRRPARAQRSARARTPTTACSTRPSRRAASRPRGTTRRTAPRSTRSGSGAAGLVVVASVVEEVDPCVARGPHHGDPASRGMRSNVRHEPSDRRETSSSEEPSRLCSMPGEGFMAGRLRNNRYLRLPEIRCPPINSARRAERRGVPRTVRGPRPARLLTRRPHPHGLRLRTRRRAGGRGRARGSRVRRGGRCVTKTTRP